MFRAVIVGPYQDELAEGFGFTRLEALQSAKDDLGTWNTELWNAGECSVEYHREDSASYIS